MKVDRANFDSSTTGTLRRFTLPGLRWWIIALVFGATVINILDRLSVSVLAPVIREQLHLTNLAYAEVGTWFLLAYTLSQGVSGWMQDRIGARRGFVVSVTVWSLAALSHAWARGFGSLCFFRVVLGMGEGGNWPGAIKVITDWFPKRERSFALGIVNGGSSVGAMVAPPIIVWLQLAYGWQAAFLGTGSLGLIWLVAWLIFYRARDRHPWLSASEAAHIDGGQERRTDDGLIAIESPAPRWIELLAIRQTWAIILSRLLVDPVWWLYILWLPEYLHKVRGLSMEEIGTMASLPFIAAGAGGLTGGALSGYLLSRGWTLNWARKSIVIVAAGFMCCGILAARAEHTAEAIAWISVVTFGFQMWISNVQILPSDLFPPGQVASVAGLGGVGAGLGSMAFTLTTGWVVDHYSYGPILVAAGLLGPLGTVALFFLLGRVEPIETY